MSEAENFLANTDLMGDLPPFVAQLTRDKHAIISFEIVKHDDQFPLFTFSNTDGPVQKCLLTVGPILDVLIVPVLTLPADEIVVMDALVLSGLNVCIHNQWRLSCVAIFVVVVGVMFGVSPCFFYLFCSTTFCM